MFAENELLDRWRYYLHILYIRERRQPVVDTCSSDECMLRSYTCQLSSSPIAILNGNGSIFKGYLQMPHIQHQIAL